MSKAETPPHHIVFGLEKHHKSLTNKSVEFDVMSKGFYMIFPDSEHV